MAGTNGRPRRGRPEADLPPARVWPDDQPGPPPLEGIVPALGSFAGIGDAAPLDIELRVSAFVAELGAGAPGGTEPGEPGHEDLVNGLVEVCLHHLDADPPRVIVDFCWVLDAFGLGYVQWPLHERLASSSLPALPAWAWAVGSAEITGARLVRHELGDGHDVVLTARHPGAEKDHVLAVYVDRNLDGMAKDLLVHEDAEAFLRLSSEAPGMTVEPLDPAVAAATIDDALDRVFEVGGQAPVADQFASLFTVVDHYVAKAPPGGTPLAGPPAATEAEQADVVDRFLADPAGAGFGERRDVLLDAVEFVVDELGGDPLRWSPTVTHLVAVGWYPLSRPGAVPGDGFTDLLRAFVPWAHAEHGWADRYLAEALAVLDAAEAGDEAGAGRVEILEEAVTAGIDLDDEEALDAFLDEYLDE